MVIIPTSNSSASMNDHTVISGGDASSSSRATSRGLLERARAGDATAWDRLVTLYAPLAFYWCRRRGLQETDAADVVQDVFQAVSSHLGSFRVRGEGDTFRGWLRTITENKIRDLFRRRGGDVDGVGGTEAQRRLHRVPAPTHDGGRPPEGEWDGGFVRRALDAVRQEFEERTWEAFRRTTIDGRLPADVGAELAMSPGAVRVAKSRVLKRLREILGDHDPAPSDAG
jgi:RNA polymerase sigma-70 factor (ECF subfamily)